MPEQTGSREDLRIDCSRCLPIRYDESVCRRCIDICPHNAITITEQLRIDPERCKGCLLCSSVCPSGALEQSADFIACAVRLAKVPEPVLGCCRTKEQANGWLACLGGLSDEHLLYLSHRLTGRLSLNLSHCGDCPNSSMLPLLQTHLDNLTPAGSCRITTVHTVEAVRHREESVDRRSFFKSFRSSLFQTAAVVLQTGLEPVERTSSYGDKRVPLRRELLNKTILKLPEEDQCSVTHRYNHRISFTLDCSACQGCVAICPTGALKTTDRAQHPAFQQDHCTGCGLCVEFCMDQAISL